MECNHIHPLLYLNEGKSTVVSLIERFYDPATGRILLGGQDLREIPLDVLRGELIGYISQEPQIFNTTIRENIRFGRLNATDAEVGRWVLFVKIISFSNGCSAHIPLL
ncbi:unnamed protein product [Echinostoma caproni]|uniref:ABC transporter domain-containing protein n=1 Tax=Echinostoma caproni TaxID=27848 RepID=A0A183B7A4_9TREM|nr:unnamed protein product [Echinostoma caproni]